jgi:PAS domain S-box-containing protein
MQLFKKKGLVIFICLFAVLLIFQTGLIISYRNSLQQLNASSNETKTQAIALTTKSVEGIETQEATLPSLDSVMLVQLLLAASGIALIALVIKLEQQNNKNLTSLVQEIAQNNTGLIFNSKENVDYTNEKEIKSRLIKNLTKVSEFIKAISNGNYGITWEGMTEENKEANKETIAGHLLHMRDQMQLVKEQDQIRMWTTEGLSKFGEIIRKHQDNFDKLSENLISNVVNYVGAKVGGLFIVNENETTNEKSLTLRACYAYDRKKYLDKEVTIGEGIVGQCYVEGQTIYMTKIPNHYLAITSGLGGTNPSSLLVIPLKTNDKIEGVLELASFKPFRPHEIQFLEKLGELLASSIATVRTGEKTTHLLAISQEQTEEMRAQEEEMRQNMEELEATQEQMQRTVGELATLKETLEKEKYLLDSLMDNIPDAIYFKDRMSRFIRVSKYLASHFSGNVDALIGKSDFDFQDRSRAQQAFDDEKNIMETRKPKIDYIEKEVMTDGSEHWVSTTKMPLINARGEVVGTFGISRDVTKLKKLELAVEGKDKNLAEEKKQYEEKIKSLETKVKNLERTDD